MARILTGIQSSGLPHLGNILGAIQPAIDLSNNPHNESFFFIADLHSLTTLKDGAQRELFVRSIASTWLAFGFDTTTNVFWRQSRIQEHTELAWYLNCFTPYPMLANATSFKEKSQKLNSVNAGLFTYPVLQAADILLYNANIIPVGKDQKQHLEMAKDIASSFNNVAGEEILALPEARIDEKLMTIPGTDGQKMSKSYNNYINIFLPEKELFSAIKKIVSDSTPIEQSKNPDTDITFKLFSLLASDSEIATMRSKYLLGGYGYGHAKKDLLSIILDKYSLQRETYKYYMNNNSELESILKTGEEKARIIARETIAKVRRVLGFGA